MSEPEREVRFLRKDIKRAVEILNIKSKQNIKKAVAVSTDYDTANSRPKWELEMKKRDENIILRFEDPYRDIKFDFEDFMGILEIGRASCRERV